MSDTLLTEQELANKYPELFTHWHTTPAEAEPPVPSLAVDGFRCGKGWHGVIEAMCEQLDQLDVSIEFTTIKEKFGKLRVYHGSEISGPDGQIQKARGVIRHAQEMSKHICEDCGNSANTEKQQGWYRTLCNDCWTERKSRVRDE